MSERKARDRKHCFAIIPHGAKRYDEWTFVGLPPTVTDGVDVVELLEVRPDDELERLRVENEHLERQLADERSGQCDKSLEKHLRWELERLREAAAGLREALEFYSDKSNYEVTINGHSPIFEDAEDYPSDPKFGKRAREALAKFEAAIKGESDGH